MANSVYVINKGINRSIEFKGLRAQYIWYLGIGLVGLLAFYAGLHFFKVNDYIALLIVGILGAAMVFKTYEMSNKYGEHGLSKMLAKRKVPKLVRMNSRRIFILPAA